MPSHLLTLLRSWYLAEQAREYSTARYYQTLLLDEAGRYFEEEKAEEGKEKR